MSEHEQWHWQEPGEAWKGIGIYHVTLTIPSREPLLGTLEIPNGDPSKAWVDPSPLGCALLSVQKGLSSFYPEIQVLHYCLMPDHLHAVCYVKRRMPRGISSAARGFWQFAKKLGRAYAYLSSFCPNSIRGNCQERITLTDIQSTSESLRDVIGAEAYDALMPVFSEMPFLRPMGHRSQLPATIRYIDMNPQRLATKRLMPGFFRVQPGLEIAGRTYTGVGNTTLLLSERFAPVHVRRTMVEGAEHGDDRPLRDYMNGCVLAAQQGVVMVSPFISPHEKAILDILLREKHPFILLADNGFRDYYKPSDSLFDACAAGLLLILSPWPYDSGKRHISRADCVALNTMAEEISSPL